VHPAPAFSVADVSAGWVEALRAAGQHVLEYDLGARVTFYSSAMRQAGEGTFMRYLTAEQAHELAVNGIYAALFKARPDVLMVVSGFFIPPEVLDRAKRSGARVVLVHTEQPYEQDRQLTLAPFADLNLVDDMVGIENYQAIGPTAYVPKAYRPSVHCPGPSVPELECDLAFVGTGYRSRVEFFEAMDLSGLDVLLAGNWQELAEDSSVRPFLVSTPEDCLENERTVEVYRSAKVGLNLYRREAQRPELSAGWSMGPREVEMAAIGLPFARDPRGEGDEVLPMLPTFADPGEASQIVRWFLDHDAEREKASLAIREAVAWRTFDHHAAVLLHLLEN
jgi:hypothetical protein